MIFPSKSIRLASFCILIFMPLGTQAAELQRLQHRISTTEVSDATLHERWGLNVQEWRKHLYQLQGIRSRFSVDGISPLEVLGIHADSEAERRRYAELWAKMVLADTRRVLAFQNAFDDAMRRLIENEPLIDVSKIPAKKPLEPDLLDSDRLLIFVDTECASCRQLTEALLVEATHVARLDFYFVDSEALNELAIQNWARQNKISLIDVQQQRITLNHDNGLLSRVFPRLESLPVVLRERGDALELVDLAALL